MSLEEKLNSLSSQGYVRLVFYPANHLFRNAPHWQATFEARRDTAKIEVKGCEMSTAEGAIDSLLGKLTLYVSTETRSRWLR